MPKGMSKPKASSDEAPNLNELDNKASMFAFTITHLDITWELCCQLLMMCNRFLGQKGPETHLRDGMQHALILVTKLSKLQSATQNSSWICARRGLLVLTLLVAGCQDSIDPVGESHTLLALPRSARKQSIPQKISASGVKYACEIDFLHLANDQLCDPIYLSNAST
jgi:hypothetical protein